MNMSAMDMSPEWPAAILAWPVTLAQTLIFGSALLCLLLHWRNGSSVQTGDALARTLSHWWPMLALIVAVVSPLIPALITVKFQPAALMFVCINAGYASPGSSSP